MIASSHPELVGEVKGANVEVCRAAAEAVAKKYYGDIKYTLIMLDARFDVFEDMMCEHPIFITNWKAIPK